MKFYKWYQIAQSVSFGFNPNDPWKFDRKFDKWRDLILDLTEPWITNKILLIHSFPMYPFSTSRKQGVKKGGIGNEWVNKDIYHSDRTNWFPIWVFKNDKNNCSCISWYCQNMTCWYDSERVPFKLHFIKKSIKIYCEIKNLQFRNKIKKINVWQSTLVSSSRFQHSFFRMTGTQTTYMNVVSMSHAAMRMWNPYHYLLFLMFQWPRPT